VKKIKLNLAVWVAIFGVFGYMSAAIFADPTWVTSENTPEFYKLILLIKDVFIQSLKMLVAPLIFFSLLGGLAGIKEAWKLKKLGGIAVTYYVSTTLIAILIGLTVVFFIHPWKNSTVRVNVQKSQSIGGDYHTKKPKKMIDAKDNSIITVVHKILKTSLTNPLESLVTNNILGLVCAALLIGLAMVTSLRTDSQLFLLIEDINRILTTILGWFITLSPIGIFAIVFDFKLKVTGDLFTQLFAFAAVVFGATLVHGAIVLPIIAKIFGGIGPITLFRKIANPLFIALGTSSSSATLPVTMKTCEEELGVSKAVSGFVFPLGATMNMDGTALFEGIAAIFLAHLYGVELTTFTIFAIFFMSMISSIGAPGMPSGSMSGMQMVLLAAGIPLEAIGILLVIEKPLDTFRTAVNVEGDIIGALVVQKTMERRNIQLT